MSENQNSQDQDAEGQTAQAAASAQAPKAAKKETVYTDVTYPDGRVAKFPGNRKMQKEYGTDAEGSVFVRFDFVNGVTLTHTIAPSDPLLTSYIGHGAAQKIGDETAGEKDVDDMVIAVEAKIKQLAGDPATGVAGIWNTGGGSGDSFSGASVVLKALVEVTNLSLEKVKANIEKKLAETPTLTRNDLYKSFRNPSTKTGQVIARMEQEKAAKNVKIDADAEVAGWN
jgi:hypothetical protein